MERTPAQQREFPLLQGAAEGTGACIRALSMRVIDGVGMALMQDGEDRPLAFLFPAFPVLHQTFALWEVVALRQLGIGVSLYSIKRPDPHVQQPEGRALIPEVHYLPGLLSLAVFGANVRVLRRHPRRWVTAYARLLREWWKDWRALAVRRRRRARPEPVEQLLSARERVRAYMNTSPLVYLLRSVALVPRAMYLGEVLQASGMKRVHAHWATYSTTMALVLAWVFDMTFSFTAHAYDIYLVSVLLPVKVRAAEFVVTCARVNAEHLRRLAGPEAGGRIMVNYHGVDMERFRPRPGPRRRERPTLVTCGSLRLYKGHHVLLRACAQMRAAARCVIIGDGPQRAALERQAELLGIAERVVFTGALPQDEVVAWYREADLFVLASLVIESTGRRDVIPNVLVEAMAMELAVVTTRVSGIPELVTDGETGRLVPANDPAELGSVMDELLRDEEQRRRLASAGRRKVAADFDRRANIRELAALFREGA